MKDPSQGTPYLQTSQDSGEIAISSWRPTLKLQEAEVQDHMNKVTCLSYLQDCAPFRLAPDILTWLEHPEGDAVQEDNQHADVLEPGGKAELRRT